MSGTECAGMPALAWAAYRRHKANASTRGIPWLFSPETWWAWWQTDARWSERGTGKPRLVMGRIGDVGPYSPENVRPLTPEQNNAERAKVCKDKMTAAAFRTALDDLGYSQAAFARFLAAHGHDAADVARSVRRWCQIGPPAEVVVILSLLRFKETQ